MIWKCDSWIRKILLEYQSITLQGLIENWQVLVLTVRMDINVNSMSNLSRKWVDWWQVFSNERLTLIYGRNFIKKLPSFIDEISTHFRRRSMVTSGNFSFPIDDFDSIFTSIFKWEKIWTWIWIGFDVDFGRKLVDWWRILKNEIWLSITGPNETDTFVIPVTEFQLDGLQVSQNNFSCFLSTRNRLNFDVDFELKLCVSDQ